MATRYITANTTAAQRLRALGPFAPRQRCRSSPAHPSLSPQRAARGLRISASSLARAARWPSQRVIGVTGCGEVVIFMTVQKAIGPPASYQSAAGQAAHTVRGGGVDPASANIGAR